MPFLIILSLLAAFSFSFLFYYQRLGPLDFWWFMAWQLLFFFALIIIFDARERSLIKRNMLVRPIRNIFLGLLAAFLLYGLFYLSFLFILKIWPQSGSYVHNVYILKKGVPNWRLAFLLGLLIGPGEEILWRWFLQRRWGERIGRKKSFLLIAFIYTLIHITSGNPFLVLAALICGLFWGWLFFQFDSLLINIVSHSFWDVAIFILWPLI